MALDTELKQVGVLYMSFEDGDLSNDDADEEKDELDEDDELDLDGDADSDSGDSE